MTADAYHRRTTFASASGHSPRRPPLTRGHPNRQQPRPPLPTLGGQFHRQASPAGECLLQADASRRWMPSSGRLFPQANAFQRQTPPAISNSWRLRHGPSCDTSHSKVHGHILWTQECPLFRGSTKVTFK